MQLSEVLGFAFLIRRRRQTRRDDVTTYTLEFGMSLVFRKWF